MFRLGIGNRFNQQANRLTNMVDQPESSTQDDLCAHLAREWAGSGTE